MYVTIKHCIRVPYHVLSMMRDGLILDKCGWNACKLMVQFCILWNQTKASKKGQRGVISALAFNPDYSGIYAAGSYAKTICLYSEAEGELYGTLEGHVGGITKLKFSPCGNYLYSGARKDPNVLCWDIRKSGLLSFLASTCWVVGKVHTILPSSFVIPSVCLSVCHAREVGGSNPE